MADWLSYAIPAAVGLGTAYLGSQATKKAASTAAASADRAAQMSAAATDRAADVTWDMFNANRADLAPFREVGLRGLAGYESQLGPGFQESPATSSRWSRGPPRSIAARRRAACSTAARGSRS